MSGQSRSCRGWANLTPREAEVAMLVSRGLRNAEIAVALGLGTLVR